MKKHIVTNADVDGALAASVVIAAEDWDLNRDRLHFTNYRTLTSTLHDIIANRGVTDIYVTDLGLQEVDEDLFNSLIGSGRVHVIDHHTLNPDREAKILESGGAVWRPKGSEMLCSAELAILAMAVPRPQQLELIAHMGRADDFGDTATSEDAQRLAELMCHALVPGSGLSADAVISDLSSELRTALESDTEIPFRVSSRLTSQLEVAAKHILELKGQASAALEVEVTHVRSPQFGQIQAAHAQVPRVLFGKPGIKAIEKKAPNADVLIAFFGEGECWAFPRGFPRGNIDLLPFLQAAGGGGRDGGGGFLFESPTSAHNYRNRTSAVLSALTALGDEETLLAAAESLRRE